MEQDFLKNVSQEDIVQAIREARQQSDVVEAGSATEKMEKLFGHVLEIIVRNDEIRTWKERWPNYCKKCSGTGIDYTPGDMYGPEQSDPCPSCTDQGLCARCKGSGLTSEERGDTETGRGPCTLCGWNYDDSLPPAYD